MVHRLPLDEFDRLGTFLKCDVVSAVSYHFSSIFFLEFWGSVFWKWPLKTSKEVRTPLRPIHHSKALVSRCPFLPSNLNFRFVCARNPIFKGGGPPTLPGLRWQNSIHSSARPAYETPVESPCRDTFGNTIFDEYLSSLYHFLMVFHDPKIFGKTMENEPEGWDTPQILHFWTYLGKWIPAVFHMLVYHLSVSSSGPSPAGEWGALPPSKNIFSNHVHLTYILTPEMNSPHPVLSNGTYMFGVYSPLFRSKKFFPKKHPHNSNIRAI